LNGNYKEIEEEYKQVQNTPHSLGNPIEWKP